LVEVPVVVRERATGRAVEGLTVSDFVVLENGKPQKVEFFHAYRAEVTGAAGMRAAARRGEGQAVFRNRREAAVDGMPVVAVLIDGYNARFEDQYFASQAAAKVIESRERRALWGIYFLGKHGIRILHDYSTNTESVVERLRRLRSAGDSAIGLGAEAGDWRPTFEQMPGVNRFGLQLAAEEEIRILTTLQSLRDVGRHLSALPGRKSLIWMTAGLPLRDIIRGFPEFWRHTVDTLNDANVAVYSIDSEGVRTTRKYLAETPGSRSINKRGALGSPMENTQVMGSLSEATGGRWFLNSNDLARGVDESLADSQVYYRLAYRATRQKWDGSQVALQVKVPGRKGLEVRHRLSYTARPSEPLQEKARNRLLADAMISPLEAVEIGVTARLARVEGSNERELDLTLDPGSVTLKEAAGRYQGRFDVRCLQASAESKVLDDFTDEVSLNLQPSEAERTHEEGFNYRRRLRIRPEAHTLKVAFCDQVTGRVGSLRIQLVEDGRAVDGAGPP
jgi:VWFA-related protein